MNPRKVELVVYHRTVQCLKISAMLVDTKIKDSKTFGYLEFHLDAKLSFSWMLDVQFIKLR